MKICAPNRRPGSGGFTLLEVLVSAAVLSIVLAIMFSALSTSMALWRNTDNKIIADREARAVGQLLSRDLASVVMPPLPALWPSITNNGADRLYLRFLTAMPADAQAQNAAESGDVCYVEYAVIPSTNGPGKEVRRLLLSSGETYEEVLSAGRFPPVQAADRYQSLGLNLLSSNSMAARGLSSLPDWINATNFMLVANDMLPFTGANSASYYPVAVEVNFAVADPETLANTNVIALTNFVLRNAGLYSFRIALPKPPVAP